MIDPSQLPAAPTSILVTRLDALGDIVLGTMLLSGLHARWPDAKLQLIVRPQLGGVKSILPDWVAVHALPFDPRESVIGREEQIIEQLREFSRQFDAELAVVAEYNRTWAGEILAGLCSAGRVLAFDGPTGLNAHHRGICAALGSCSQENWQTIRVDAELRESAKYAAFLAALGRDAAEYHPHVCVGNDDRQVAAGLWHQTGIESSDAIVCFPGSGSSFSRSLDSQAWARWIGRLAMHRPVVLLGSTLDEPVIDAIAALGLPQHVGRIFVPAEQIGVTAALMEQALAYIGMDTGPMHIAAALGKKTLGVFGGGHRAERFVPAGKKAAAVRMPIGCYGCDWHCPFDRRLCIKDIPEQPLFEIAETFLNDDRENPDPLQPRIFDVPARETLPAVTLGPIMRQHRQLLSLNHNMTEHHAFLAVLHEDHARKLSDITATLQVLTQHNHERKLAFASLSEVITEMSAQNRDRDGAIAHLGSILGEMSEQNRSRDEAIAHLSHVITEMSAQNQSRDGAIDHINGTLAEMTVHNESRDQAIATIAQRTEGLDVKT